MKSQISQEKTVYKKIKEYLISLSQKHFLGKGRLGQVRQGYNQKTNQILLFKITSLPLSQRQSETFQKHLKLNSNELQIMYQPVNSSTKCYVPYQFLPKILIQCKSEYKDNQLQLNEVIGQILQSYSYLYYMGVGHGNLKITNIGFDSQNKLKLMDFIYSNNFNSVCQRDMVNFGLILYELYYGNEYKQGQKNKRKQGDIDRIIMGLVNKLFSWQQIFDRYKIINKYTRLVKQLKFNVQNRIIVLSNIYKQLQNSETHAYLKISILKFIQNLLKKQLQSGEIVNKKYEDILRTQLERCNTVCKKLRKSKYLGIKDLLFKNQFFNINKRTIFCILSCCHRNLNHQYIYEQFIKQVNDNQIQIIYQTYFNKTILNQNY